MADKSTALLRPYVAIDIGSNSVHMIMVSLGEKGEWTLLDKNKAHLSLGKQIDPRTQELSGTAIELLLDTLSQMISDTAEYQPIYRVIATHVGRVASNFAKVIELAQERLQITIEVIDGMEEARLGAMGVTKGLAQTRNLFLGMDLGGGSTELVVFGANLVLYANSQKIGSQKLGLLTQSRHSGSLRQLAKETVDEYFSEVRQQLMGFAFDHMIVTSGTAKAIAKMLYRQKTGLFSTEVHGYEWNLEQLEVLLDQCSALKDPEQLAKYYKIGKRRATMIRGSLAGFVAIGQLLKIKRWKFSGWGLRHGIVMDLHERRRELERVDTASRGLHLQALAERYQVDVSHAREVGRIAQFIHQQWRSDKVDVLQTDISESELLDAAATLHEVGKFINKTRYHRHSAYIVEQTWLPGYSEREQRVVSLICRYHRKGLLKSDSKRLAGLRKKEIRRVAELSALLRLAVASQRTRRKRVTAIDLRTDVDNRLELTLHHTQPIDAEMIQLQLEAKRIGGLLSHEIVLVSRKG